MHLETGHLNYISNSNLDYNNPTNVRRIGAFAGVDYQPMNGIAIRSNPKIMQFDGSFAGLVVNEMGGFMDTAQEQVMEKPFLWAGIALIAYPYASKSLTKKKVSPKTEKQLLYAGLGSIAFHFVKPMLMGE